MHCQATVIMIFGLAQVFGRPSHAGTHTSYEFTIQYILSHIISVHEAKTKIDFHDIFHSFIYIIYINLMIVTAGLCIDIRWNYFSVLCVVVAIYFHGT